MGNASKKLITWTSLAFQRCSRRLEKISPFLFGAAIFLAFTSALTYVVASIMDDKNPRTRRVWQLSALSGLTAFLIEVYLAFVEKRRAKEDQARLESKLESTNEMLRKQQLRKLSAEEAATIRKAISSYAPQQVFVLCRDHPEAIRYGEDFVREFNEAKWKAELAVRDVPLRFENVEVAVSDRHATDPKAAAVLQKTLLALGIVKNDPGFVPRVPGLPTEIIQVRIGTPPR
jgi:hypothetical protein